MKTVQKGERSASLISAPEMRKKRSGGGINWLYILAANAVIVDLIFVWFIASRNTGTTVSVGQNGLVSRAPTTYVGFMILGANRFDYPLSMDQRIQKAFLQFSQTCNKPNYQGVFFPTGKNNAWKGDDHRPEAAYISRRIMEKYDYKMGVKGKQPSYLKRPIIVEEGNARFTVDNFLKTIPKISEYQRENKLRFKVVYLVTNEYHMGRSTEILKQFQHQGLVDFLVAPCEVDKRICDQNKDAKLTKLIDSGKWDFEENIRQDSGRDIKNSASFARAIFMKVHEQYFDAEFFQSTYTCDKLKYAKANCGGDSNPKWGEHEKVGERLDDFDELVNAYVNLILPSHSHTDESDRRIKRIMDDEDNIMDLLYTLQHELGEEPKSCLASLLSFLG